MSVFTEILEEVQLRLNEKNSSLSAKEEQRMVLVSEIATVEEDISKLNILKTKIEEAIAEDDGEGPPEEPEG